MSPRTALEPLGYRQELVCWGFFSPSLSRVIYQVNCHLETWKELGFFVSETWVSILSVWQGLGQILQYRWALFSLSINNDAHLIGLL